MSKQYLSDTLKYILILIYIFILIGVFVSCELKDRELEQLKVENEYNKNELRTIQSLAEVRGEKIKEQKEFITAINITGKEGCIDDLYTCKFNIKGTEPLSFFIQEEGKENCQLLYESCTNSETRYGINCTWMEDLNQCRCYAPAIR